MRIVIHATVAKVEEEKRTRWKSGLGRDAEFETYSIGWFMHITGSWEKIKIGEPGEPEPKIKVGAAITITIEEIVN